jgi:hypothetical protein
MADERVDKIRASDAEVGIADPQAATDAINALTDDVTFEVWATDIRALLWPKLEYAELVLIGRRGEAEFNDTDKPRALTKLALTAVSFCDSGRSVRVEAVDDWTSIVNGLNQLATFPVQPPLVSQESYHAVVALRVRKVNRHQPPISVQDLLSIRSSAP